MSKYKMISPKVPNVPWQERPAELNGAPVWRYKENPVIGRNPQIFPTLDIGFYNGIV